MAMDIPFPVTGGIIVSASPIRIPERAEAFFGVRERAAIELNEDSSQTASFNLWESRECGSPESHSFQEEERSGIAVRERKRPQTLT
jgi:hypothetical protein